MTDRLVYWIWLASIPGLGSASMRAVTEAFGEPSCVYSASEAEIRSELEGRITPIRLNSLISARSRDLSGAYTKLSRIRGEGIRIITCLDSEYPEKFRHLHDYPVLFYLRGRLPDPDHYSLAIVGARTADSYGREMARYLARELAGKNVDIISGLASGVDASSHEGALEAGGYTMGILGCGINICYPKENYYLYRRVVLEGGILSEYPLDVKPSPGLFPVRNRLIAALSDGILVTQARKRSGSLITVDQGLELGRDIYAVPGNVDESLSEGCNDLIKCGAKMVTCPSDILEEMGIFEEQDSEEKKPGPGGLSSAERMVYSCMKIHEQSIQDIMTRCDMPFTDLLFILHSLTKKKLIVQVRQNYYRIIL